MDPADWAPVPDLDPIALPAKDLEYGAYSYGLEDNRAAVRARPHVRSLLRCQPLSSGKWRLVRGGEGNRLRLCVDGLRGGQRPSAGRRADCFLDWRRWGERNDLCWRRVKQRLTAEHRARDGHGYDGNRTHG